MNRFFFQVSASTLISGAVAPAVLAVAAELALTNTALADEFTRSTSAPRRACVGAQRLGDAEPSDDCLQKQLVNPVAALVALPFRYTGTAHVGTENGWLHVFDIQPVYPLALGEINLINRVTLPLIWNPNGAKGLGDIVYEGLLSPGEPAGDVIWGFGPIFSMKSATDARLGSGRYTLGPALVLLTQPGAFSFGALVSQHWSFPEPDSRPELNFAELEPILGYRLTTQCSLDYAGIITANWAAKNSQRYTVPLGLTLSELVKPGGFVPVNIMAGGGYNVVHPDFGGDWFVRVQMTFLPPT